MTVPSLDVTPLRRARVAVVLNANDHDHFAVSGEAVFRQACPPWADLVFLGDHDLGERLMPILAEGRVDAVVFASNSLITAAARQATGQEAFRRLWADDGRGRDVGVVVLHQYLRPGVELALDFLGSAALTLVGERPRAVRSTDIRYSADWLLAEGAPGAAAGEPYLAVSVGYGPKKYCLWSHAQPRYPQEWQRVVWEQSGATVVAACDVGPRVVVASSAPLDLIGAADLLGSAVAAVLRPRGCLLVEAATTSGATAFTPALASAIERGLFLYRIRPSEAAQIDPAKAPYGFFDELIIAPEWRVEEIAALDERAILRRLEQGGSLVVTFAGPRGSHVSVRLHSQPQYAQRANGFASWLLPRLDSFAGDIWATRALAEVVVAVRQAFTEPRLVPQALRADFVRRHVEDALVARIENDSVDDNVLATVATYAALCALGVQGHEALRSFVERRIDREPPSVLAQALHLVPDLRTPQRLERVRAAARAGAADDEARLLRGYAAVLVAETDIDLLRSAARDSSLGLGVQAELLRAMVRSSAQPTDEMVALAARVRERIDRLSAREGGLESVCVGTAALVELARRQGVGPTTAATIQPRELDARTVENTELVREREDALRAAARYRHVGRQAVTVLLGLLTALGVVAVAAIMLWGGGEVRDRAALAFGAIGLLTAAIGYVTRRAAKAGLTPWSESGDQASG